MLVVCLASWWIPIVLIMGLFIWWRLLIFLCGAFCVSADVVSCCCRPLGVAVTRTCRRTPAAKCRLPLVALQWRSVARQRQCAVTWHRWRPGRRQAGCQGDRWRHPSAAWRQRWRRRGGLSQGDHLLWPWSVITNHSNAVTRNLFRGVFSCTSVPFLPFVPLLFFPFPFLFPASKWSLKSS